MKKGFSSVLLQLAALFSLSAQCDDIAALRNALKETGRHHVNLGVAHPEHSTILPITVIVGKRHGPTLLVLSGVHGSEYAPITASQRLAQEIEPSSVAGNVLFVHITNLPAYLGRAIYTSPADGKNLNRLFPGKPNGSLSERIAFVLTDQIYPLVDAVLDMHSGDGNEDLNPMWVGYYGKAGNQQVIQQSKAMAFAFGFEYIVEFEWQLTDPAKAIWAGSAAIAQGIPSIDVEAGGKNVVNAAALAAIESGVRRVMTHLGMSTQRFPSPPQPTIIRNRTSVTAPQDGSWVTLVQAGDPVAKGALIGYLTDWHGRKLFEARAPHAGLVLLTLTAPPVRAGETLAVIASVNQH